MKRDGVCRGFLIPAVALAACLAGCSDSTEGPERTPSPYGDLTDKEHCIRNLVASHKLKDIEEYSKLLHDDYRWYDKKWGLFGDEHGVIDRADDIEFTRVLFLSAITVDLELSLGSWSVEDMIGGEPCVGCWKATGMFHFEAYYALEGRSYDATGPIKVVVVPVDDSGTTRYYIRLMELLGDPI